MKVWLELLGFLCLLFGLPCDTQHNLVNIALGKNATQLDTYYGHGAERAVDGNPDPAINNGYCSVTNDPNFGLCLRFGWWMVDFGSVRAVHSVTLWSREATHVEHQLGYISIRVSDSSDIRDHKQIDECAAYQNDTFPESSSMDFECKEIMYGRYLSIQRTRGFHYIHLTLCEVQVWGRPLDTDCSRCLLQQCGDRCEECEAGWKAPECTTACDAGYYGDSCSQSCGQGCPEVCDPVTGHCPVPCADGWQGDGCDQTPCKPGLQQPDCMTVCDKGTYGPNCAQECSDNCLGSCGPVDGRCNKNIANVALDRPTWQSGLDWILTSDLAVDGDPDPDLENKHCACTSWPRFNTSKCMETGWWMVDLGSPVEIEEVVLVGSYENKTMGYISIRVSNHSVIDLHTLSDECFFWDGNEFPSGNPQTLRCRQPMTGQYLSIQRTNGTKPYKLCLCEVIVSGHFQVPIIDDIDPLYGPVSGGTNVTIVGRDLEAYDPDGGNSEPIVKVDDLECRVLSWNATVIVVSTPPANDDTVVNSSLFISLSLKNRRTVRSKEFFTYRPNPRLTDVYPREALSTGGIRLTVIGEFLDSVAKTILTVLKIDTNNSITDEEKFEETCTEAERKKMICLTPKVVIPFVQREGQFEFVLGFKLDGHGEYSDLRTSPISDRAYIDIIRTPPELETWSGSKEHQAGSSLVIRGDRLTIGCTEDDYNVEVGQGTCSEIHLAMTSITCNPPDPEPAKIETLASSDGHRVMVHIGNHHVQAGFLEYVDDKWYLKPLVLAGIAAGCFIVLLVILVPVCVCVCRRSRARKKQQQQQQQQQAGTALQDSPVYLSTRRNGDTPGVTEVYNNAYSMMTD